MGYAGRMTAASARGGTEVQGPSRQENGEASRPRVYFIAIKSYTYVRRWKSRLPLEISKSLYVNTSIVANKIYVYLYVHAATCADRESSSTSKVSLSNPLTPEQPGPGSQAP